jgi:hypothetical protein
VVLLLAAAISGCRAPLTQPVAEPTASVAAPILTAPTVAPTLAATLAPAVTSSPTPAASPTVLPTAAPTLAAVEDVIAYEMQGAFDFFWEQANTEADSPGYGLIRDRYPGSPGIASIASVGFGLTAYAIGVELGYVEHAAAAERTDLTLDTLQGMDRVEGFYYHFVGQETGERAWESEVSSIDTAILLMGVLTAGQYFGGEIAEKAQQIYAGVNWPWFVDESRGMFYMAYRPEKGFEGHWDFYAEQLMLYVLAAGSDTFPVDDSTYYGFTRHRAEYGNGQPFIHSWFGSLFTYQYSHAWIDFRGYVDKQGVNWFDNSVEASLAHFNFAVDMDDQYETLGPLAWGLTASDGPDGYNGLYGAPPSGFDNRAHVVDDTVAPAGAIGSILFLPEQVEQAMQHYFADQRLLSPYGFLDAYNLTRNWYATDVIGIDKGIALLMLANYQSDLVYQITMSHPNLLHGLAQLQLVPEQ